MSTADNLRALQPTQAIRAYSILEVVGLAGATAVVATDGIAENTYPCLSGYARRAPGDVVLAIQLASGGWVVLGSLPAAADPDYVTASELEDLLPKPAPVVKVDWGTSAPSGSGWVQPSAMYLRTTATGDIEIYGQTTAAPAPPTTKPGKAPAPVTITSDSAGSWRTSGSQTDETPKAGAWTGADWYGAWFFGSKIAAACAGKTVDSMELSVRRDASSHGVNRGVTSRFFLHNLPTRKRPSTSTKRFTGPKLSRGQSVTFTLPADQRAALASGDQSGVGVYGSGSSQQIYYDETARLKIIFK